VSMAHLLDRLSNWGAWARADDTGPSGHSIASFWRKWLSHKAWDDGWGEQTTPEAGHEQDVDEHDAEKMDFYVHQLTQASKAILVQKFVLRKHVHWRDVDPAVRALAELMKENVSTNRGIRVLLRGGRE